MKGNTAIAQNKEYKALIIKKDSVIVIQKDVIGVQLGDMALLNKEVTKLGTIISNQKEMVLNERKIGRKKGFIGFLKGFGAGVLSAIIGLLLI